jgi:hypothetical protein
MYKYIYTNSRAHGAILFLGSIGAYTTVGTEIYDERMFHITKTDFSSFLKINSKYCTILT